jgi:hypothetical protein
MRLMTLMQRSAAQSRHMLLGGMVFFFFFQLLLIAHAAEIERSQAFGRVGELMPGFLQRGLGAQAMLLASFKGSVSFGYFHPLVVCAVSLIAVYLATEPAHDVETGRVDLVLARSVPRHRVLTRSLLLTFAVITVLTALMVTGTYTGLRWFAPDITWPSSSVLALLAVHLIAVVWCCASISLLAAAWVKRWTSALTIGASVVVVGYLIDFLAIGWPPARVLAWAFPFNYYPALVIVAGNSTPLRDLAILLGGTAFFSALAYWKFQRRDL